jgi:YVTN family beta-propeller protein
VNQVVRTIPVGAGPRAVTAQPGGEDVLVVNSASNSLSIISGADLSVRKTVTSLLGPEAWDIASTARYQGSATDPGTFTYFAYITNRAGNSFSIFESGPTTPTMLGPDDVRAIVTDGPLGPLSQCQGLMSDHLPVRPGVWVTSPGNRSMVRMRLTAFGPPQTPQFPNPAAGARTFEITQQVDPLDPQNPLGIEPVDVCLADNIFLCFNGAAQNHKNNLRFYSPNNPIDFLGRRARLYVANRASGTVSVLDAETLLNTGEIPVPGVTLVTGFHAK